MKNQFLQNNSCWRGGVSVYRRIAFTVYKLEKKCFSCKSVKKLCVHHIDQNRKNNNKANLQILCLKCHSYLHQEGIPCSKEKKKKLKLASLGNKNALGSYRGVEHRKAVGNSNKLRVWSKKSKLKLGISLKSYFKQNGHPRKGIILSEERKQKNRDWYNSLSKKEKIEYANKRKKK